MNNGGLGELVLESDPIGWMKKKGINWEKKKKKLTKIKIKQKKVKGKKIVVNN